MSLSWIYRQQNSTWEQKSEEQTSWEQKSYLTGWISDVQEQKSWEQKSGEPKSFSLKKSWEIS